jgi:hypothetical protein
MLNFGISMENFRPIYTRKHNLVLGYQISPEHTLKAIIETNEGKCKQICKYCGKCEYEFPDNLVSYKGLGYPIYISEEILKEIELHHIIKTREYKEDVIISLEFYQYLLNKYPKIECRPVFLGCVINDPEYIRLHK